MIWEMNKGVRIWQRKYDIGTLQVTTFPGSSFSNKNYMSEKPGYMLPMTKALKRTISLRLWTSNIDLIYVRYIELILMHLLLF